MKALALLLALAGPASADVFQRGQEARTHDSLFGFRIGGGEQAIDDLDLTMTSVALAYEQRVLGALRIVAEYEYVLLGVQDTEDDKDKASDGMAHRASLVARHHLYRSKLFFDETFRLYVDFELGAAFLLGSEPMAGRIAVPQGIAGFRLGYDFIKFRKETRASKVWEPEWLFRVVATPYEKVGFFAAFGLSWGS